MSAGLASLSIQRADYQVPLADSGEVAANAAMLKAVSRSY
jgi:hypothetical protein